mgnify:CR=1 FL=1
MTRAVIAGYTRSPFHLASKGGLAKVRPDDMTAQVVRGLVERTGVDPADIEDLICGCAFPEGEQGLNMARLIGFLSDMPLSVAGATVNRFCGSSMEAAHMAAGAIAVGAGEAFICAGIESMTRVPMMGYNPLPNPYLHANYPQAYISMGLTAEAVANDRGVPVTPYAAGTSLEGNPVPAHGGISMDLTRMDGILDVRPEDLQVDVEPGVEAHHRVEVDARHRHLPLGILAKMRLGVVVIAGHGPTRLGTESEESHHVATGQGRGQGLFGVGVAGIAAPIGGGVHREFLRGIVLHGMGIGISTGLQVRFGALPMQLDGEVGHGVILMR